MVEMIVNGQRREVDADLDTPLLWILRENLALPGTKFGCGVALCGACTVHLDGLPVRSCSTPLSDAVGKSITTIEGIAKRSIVNGKEEVTLHPLQQAWIDHQVPQCGYCQSGQIMAATALLKSTPRPSDAQIDAAMTNICRCGTYTRIRAAIHSVSGDA
jgi:isoquinoline 1-oxidoreductase subunit alpha